MNVCNDLTLGVGENVPRGTNCSPDLGYHYHALDYALSGRMISDCSWTLNDGVAMGIYGVIGLKFASGVSLRAKPARDLRVRIGHF